MKVLGLLFVLLILNAHTAWADTASSGNWNLEINDLNLDTALPSPRVVKPKATKVMKQEEVKKIELPIDHPYAISTSNLVADFGILTPTNNIYRTTNITIENAENNYIVSTYEDKSLTITSSGIAIPDTTCDNGSCSSITSSLWENPLTYGFGYRCDDVIGKNCPVGFEEDNYYKRFALSSLSEDPQIVMTSDGRQKNPESQITYKLNISKNQESGSYVNNVTFVALPGY